MYKDNIFLQMMLFKILVSLPTNSKTAKNRNRFVSALSDSGSFVKVDEGYDNVFMEKIKLSKNVR